MEGYRLLTEDEIEFLEQAGCQADNWGDIYVDRDFNASTIRNVCFYGKNYLGVFDKTLEIEPGFFRRSGIRNVILSEVTIGNNCIIENIGGYIRDYIIGDECYLANIGVISSTKDATFGLECDCGLPIVCEGITPVIAYFMNIQSNISAQLYDMARNKAEAWKPAKGVIESQARIINTRTITNSYIGDFCEINGASRLNECSLYSTSKAPISIGSDAILEDCVISAGCSISAAHIDNTYVGEYVQMQGVTVSEEACFPSGTWSKLENENDYIEPYDNQPIDFLGMPKPLYTDWIPKRTNPGFHSKIITPYGASILWSIREKLYDHIKKSEGEENVKYSEDYQDIIDNDQTIRRYLKKALANYLNTPEGKNGNFLPRISEGVGEWCRIANLEFPKSELDRFFQEFSENKFNSIEDIKNFFHHVELHLKDYAWTWAYAQLLHVYELDSLTEEDVHYILNEDDEKRN